MLKRLSTDKRSDGEFSSSQFLQPIDIIGLLRKMWRQKRNFVIWPVFLAIAGLIYCLFAQPYFTSSAKLLIQPHQPLVQGLQPTGPDTETIDTAFVDSQVEVLNSSQVLKRVVASENLRDDPEFAPAAPNFLKVIISWFTSGPSVPLTEEEKLNAVIENLRNATTLKRVGFTYVLAISVATTSPQKSAAVTNAIADAYLKDNLEARSESAGAASTWLQARVNDLRGVAVSADAAVQEFRAKNNIVSTEKGLMTDQEVTEISTQLTQAKSQLAEAQAKSDKLAVELASNSTNNMAIIADLPVGSIVPKLQQDTIQNNLRIAELVKANGEQHESVLKLRSENIALATSIAQELQRIASSYKNDVAVNAQRVAELGQRLKDAVGASNDTSSAQVQLRDLQHEADSYRAIYQSSLDRLQQAVQQQSFPVSEYRVISYAVPVLQKTWPKSIITILVAILAGLGIGGVIALAKAGRDSTLRNAMDLEKELDAKLIANFPVLGHFQTLALAAISPKAELAFPARTTKIFLGQVRSVGDCLVIGVTSTFRGEGRSTVAAALAASHVASGSRTLLIDADMANPAITTAVSSAPMHVLQSLLDEVGSPKILAYIKKYLDNVG